MRILVLMILVAFSSRALALRVSEPEGPQSTTYAAFHFSPGYSYSSLLNTGGGRSIFGGPSINGELDLMVSIEQLGIGVGPFIHYSYSSQSNLRNRSDYSQELSRTDFMYGMKANINPFYAGFGYGDNTTEIALKSGSVQIMKLQSKVLGFTGGLRLFGIGGSWSVGISGW